MGTHPIFESDFDCLTDRNSDFVKKCLILAIMLRLPTTWPTIGQKRPRAPKCPPSSSLAAGLPTTLRSTTFPSPTIWPAKTDTPSFFPTPRTLPGETVSQGAMSDRRAFGELVDDARTQQRQEADDRAHRQTRVRDHPPHQWREPDPNPAPGDHQLGPARRLDPYRTRRNRPSSSRRRFAPPPRQPGDLAALHWR